MIIEGSYLMSQYEILLASRSPRRQELLQQLQIQYQTVDVEVDERVKGAIMPEFYVKSMAEAKALAALSKYRDQINHQRLLLTADTAISYGGKIIGKPESEAHFFDIMRTLSNKHHTVFTAITLVGAGCKIDAEGSRTQEKFVTMLSESRVKFSILPEDFIHHYWQSGEPQDKAGGYAIQGVMAGYIESIEGSYSGIMGLPLFELRKALEEFGCYLMDA